MKVKLSKAPGSETVIPITAANRAGASDDDHTGVPDTFAATEPEAITFAATDDRRGSPSAPSRAGVVVTITDDDVPSVL